MLHILLVDDDLLSALALRAFLERRGYRVTPAGDGPEALVRFDADPADLALVDWRMPGMNGGEVVRELRARRPLLPVVFVTGYSPEVEGFAAALPVPAAVLDKPVDPAEVLDAVRAALSGGIGPG